MESEARGACVMDLSRLMDGEVARLEARDRGFALVVLGSALATNSWWRGAFTCRGFLDFCWFRHDHRRSTDGLTNPCGQGQLQVERSGDLS